jgi:membrane protein CcdC involved in cytochrome C biogenesis
MNGFEGILFATILLAFLAGVFALIYKGSRPPQPVPEHPTPRRKAIVASLIPVVCTAILYATFKGLDLYLRDHLQVRRLPAILIIAMGMVAPWCVGIYSAYRAARAANKVLRAIGSVEVLLFLIAAAVPIVARG